MSITINFFAQLAFCLLPWCTASKSVHIGNAPRGDEVSLLQGQVEMKRSEVDGAKHFADAEKPSYALEESCPASTSCGERAKTVEPELAAHTSENNILQAATTVKSIQNDEEDVGKSKASVVRGVLEVLALLLVADVLRRSQSKNKIADTASGSGSIQVPASAGSGSALLAAALDGDDAAFEKALVGVTSTQLQQVDKWGCTVLHYAAKGGSVPIVSRLLQHDVHIEAFDAWDETPLHLAARAGHVDACKALLAAGACIDVTNAEQYTPLVVAGQASQAAVCNLLLEHGASVADLEEQEVPSILSELIAQKSCE